LQKQLNRHVHKHAIIKGPMYYLSSHRAMNQFRFLPIKLI
jgi:YHS domain-containing protein